MLTKAALQRILKENIKHNQEGGKEYIMPERLNKEI